MRILIVDDEELALEALQHALTEAGHQVVTAYDGKEAMNLLCTDPSRMVISDWMMPKMDGLELCRRIRSHRADHYTYFILLTCRGETSDIVEGLSAGADDFIAKPFDPAELCVRVRAGERILSLDNRGVDILKVARLSAWFGSPGYVSTRLPEAQPSDDLRV